MQITAVFSIVGLALAIYATIIFLIVAFRESVLWGLACFLPIFPVVFLLAHWDEAWKPFFAAFFGWTVFLTMRS